MGLVSRGASPGHSCDDRRGASQEPPLPFGFDIVPPMQKIGKYEILGQLGAGGMAVAYRALDPMLNRVVALKLISRDLVQGENAVKRFLHEARIAAALSHPNIVT